MLFDRTSEIVAHFIGVFETALDGLRLRSEIDGFRHRPNADPVFEDQSPLASVSRAPYALDGFTPGLSPYWFSPDPQILLAPPVLHFPIPIHMPFLGPKGKLDIEGPKHISISGSGIQSIGVMSRAPDTAIIVSRQDNYLGDNDFFGAINSATFLDPEIFDQQLDAVWLTAQGIMPDALASPLHLILEGSSIGETLTEDFVANDAVAETLGAKASFLSGSEIPSVTVNGVEQDVMSDIGDVLPAYLQAKNDATAADREVTAESFPSASGNSASAAAHFDVDSGHNIVAGGNMAMNETSIASLHLDAPVIAVMGDMVAVSAISQVNVIHDHNSGAVNASSTNTSINAAMFASAHNPTPEATTSLAYPSNVSAIITQVDADLISVNWIHQYNYFSDHDSAQITFSGEDTFLDFGDNVLFNQASILEFSQGYDLIIVGREMYDLSLIFQTNILFDDDSVSVADAGPYTASMSDNLAYNSASIQSTSIDTYVNMDEVFTQMGTDLAAGATILSDQVKNHDVFNGDVPMNVLYISGNFANISAIEQTNIVGDADQIQINVDALLDQSDAIITTTTGSNAALNLATIQNYGVDSTISVGGEVYDDLLLYQAELIDTDAQPLGAIPLASEAVAFLADDMIHPDYGDTETYPETVQATGSDVDMMGSIVT